MYYPYGQDKQEDTNVEEEGNKIKQNDKIQIGMISNELKKEENQNNVLMKKNDNDDPIVTEEIYPDHISVILYPTPLYVQGKVWTIPVPYNNEIVSLKVSQAYQGVGNWEAHIIQLDFFGKVRINKVTSSLGNDGIIVVKRNTCIPDYAGITHTYTKETIGELENTLWDVNNSLNCCFVIWLITGSTNDATFTAEIEVDTLAVFTFGSWMLTLFSILTIIGIIMMCCISKRRQMRRRPTGEPNGETPVEGLDGEGAQFVREENDHHSTATSSSSGSSILQ